LPELSINSSYLGSKREGRGVGVRGEREGSKRVEREKGVRRKQGE